ncbi:hypothetical protein [Algirhabdus cladophorae]|uniref:hypothetical protein n=1 Tax=Algirhabdus cladophorae TaxID=3377108 RepID=UPI003B8475A2
MQALRPWIRPQDVMDNGPFLVMFRDVNHGDGPQKKFDLMRFDEAGLDPQPCDMAQPMSHDNGII